MVLLGGRQITQLIGCAARELKAPAIYGDAPNQNDRRDIPLGKEVIPRGSDPFSVSNS
jgi:hypothetical protein